MKTANEINELITVYSKQAEKLFDLCEQLDESIYNKVHIIENSRFPDEKKEYRVYHADGYCFDVVRERIELEDGEGNDSGIVTYEYMFNEGIYEGFKDITIEEAVRIIEEI